MIFCNFVVAYFLGHPVKWWTLNVKYCGAEVEIHTLCIIFQYLTFLFREF